MVQNSAKFTAGVEVGWPKRTKINASGEYSSSASSHELPDAEAEFPTPQSSSRRRRPIGQMSAMRMARESASGSHEVQSEADSLVTPELNNLACVQPTQYMLESMDKWYAATDPVYRRMLKDAINSMRRDLGIEPLPDSGVGTGDGGDGNGGEDDEE